jgi:hypothetical protein
MLSLIVIVIAVSLSQELGLWLVPSVDTECEDGSG